MKKVIGIIVLVFCIVLQPISENVSYAAQSSKNFQNQCISRGKKLLEKYYKSINEQTTIDFLNFNIDADIENYLEYKQEIMVNRLKRSNCNVSYSDVKVECDSYEVSNDGVTAIYNVLVQRRYKGSDEIAESMNQVRLSFKNKNAVAEVADCFEYSEFDMGILEMQNENNNNDVKSTFTSNKMDKYYQIQYGSKVKKILHELKSKENETYSKIEDTTNKYKKLLEARNILFASVENSTNVASVLSVSSTSRNKIVTYAKNNCSKKSPSSGNASYAPYYDFSKLSYSYDCTNFASHCMLAGGAKPNSSKWYYKSLNDRTASWSGVNPFYEFIVNNSGNGPQAEERSLVYACPSSYVNWSNGDVIQLQYPDYGYPGFGHSTVVTGSYSANAYSYIPRVTSRTGEDWYTKNEILTVKYPISNDILAYRLIHLTNI